MKSETMKPVAVAKWNDLEDRKPAGALVANVDLVIVRYEDKVSVLYGRCLHRGALLEDGRVEGDNLICGVHDWDFRIDTGVSEYDNKEALNKFTSWIEDGKVYVDETEVAAWHEDNPQPYSRDTYLGQYADPSHGDPAEPYTSLIQSYAKDGLSKVGHHGVSSAMGVPLNELPRWEDIQFITAQLHKVPLLDDDEVGTKTVIGPLSLIHI